MAWERVLKTILMPAPARQMPATTYIGIWGCAVRLVLCCSKRTILCIATDCGKEFFTDIGSIILLEICGGGSSVTLGPLVVPDLGRYRLDPGSNIIGTQNWGPGGSEGPGRDPNFVPT